MTTKANTAVAGATLNSRDRVITFVFSSGGSRVDTRHVSSPCKASTGEAAGG